MVSSFSWARIGLDFGIVGATGYKSHSHSYLRSENAIFKGATVFASLQFPAFILRRKFKGTFGSFNRYNGVRNQDIRNTFKPSFRPAKGKQRRRQIHCVIGSSSRLATSYLFPDVHSAYNPPLKVDGVEDCLQATRRIHSPSSQSVRLYSNSAGTYTGPNSPTAIS